MNSKYSTEEILDKITSEIALKEERAINTEYGYYLFHLGRYKLLIDLILKYYQANSKLLEIGSLFCHLNIAASVIGYESYGIDLEKYTELESNAERAVKYGIKLKNCDLAHEKIPFEDNYFNIVVFSEVIEHFNFHPQAAINEIYRILKPGGKMIITTPNQNRLMNIIKLIIGRSINYDIAEEYTIATHYREYNYAELLHLCGKAGFGTVQKKYFTYHNNDFLRKILTYLFKVIPGLSDDILVIAEK